MIYEKECSNEEYSVLLDRDLNTDLSQNMQALSLHIFLKLYKLKTLQIARFYFAVCNTTIFIIQWKFVTIRNRGISIVILPQSMMIFCKSDYPENFKVAELICV